MSVSEFAAAENLTHLESLCRRHACKGQGFFCESRIEHVHPSFVLRIFPSFVFRHLPNLKKNNRAAFQIHIPLLFGR